MSLFDMLTSAIGRPPPPNQQILAGLGQAPGQAGSTTGPAPSAPPAPAPAPGGGAPVSSPGASSGQQSQQQQTPAAYQSPPDLAMAYMQLAQRQMANEQFNRGLGMMAAGFARPEDRGLIMQAQSGMTQDPGALFGNMMKIQQFNQQQQQYQSFLRAAPDIGKSLNLTPDEVLAAGPSSISSAIQANMPPEAMRNWIFAKRQWIASHPEDPQGTVFEQQFPMSLAITGAIPGLTDPDRQRIMALTKWQSANPGQTPPAYMGNTTSFQANAKDVSDAQSNFAALDQKSRDTNDAINRIKNNPNLGAALTYMTSTHGGIGADQAAKAGLLDPQTYQAITDIDLLSGQVYGEGFRSTGSKRTQQEVQAIVEGLSKLKDTGMTGDAYIKTALNPLQDRLKETMANNYGASQQLDSMPETVRDKVNPIYMPGGSLYGGEGGKWYLQGMSKDQAQTTYNQMPPGTVYVGQDGKLHKKPQEG